MKRFMPAKSFSVLFMLCVLITACKHDDEEDPTALNPYVETPANAILAREGSLHLFKLSTFTQDPADVTNDLMVFTFNNFNPASSNIEPATDEDQTLNDLGWTKTDWDENTTSWLNISSPQSSEAFQKSRQYRVLEGNVLSAPYTKLNRPTYEAIDENIYERQLAATFVWDFGSYNNLTNDSGEDVSNTQFIDYGNFAGFPVLDQTAIWAENAVFSNGAKIYGATRSIAEDKFVVEAIEASSIFNLNAVKFATGVATIEDAINTYPISESSSVHLAYTFTDEKYEQHTIFIQFDTSVKKAYIFNTNNATLDQKFEVDYTEHLANSYIEIDTSALSKSDLDGLNLPSYFNPIIVGPFTSDGTESSDISQKSYYYGKHYIKTNATSRLRLSPIFFLNTQAKTDIQNTFKAWREKRHIDGP